MNIKKYLKPPPSKYTQPTSLLKSSSTGHPLVTSPIHQYTPPIKPSSLHTICASMPPKPSLQTSKFFTRERPPAFRKKITQRGPKMAVTSIAARGGGGSFKREKIYNSEEQVPIEFVRVTCFNNAHFEEPFFPHVRIAELQKKKMCLFWHPNHRSTVTVLQ